MKIVTSYSQQDLRESLLEIGFRPGDTVSLQVSLGRLGMLEGASSYEEIANVFIDTLLEVLSPEGTLIVPCYTYSIGKGEPFEVEETPSRIGVFPEIFRKRQNVLRSRDPMLSSCGIGRHAKSILRDISNSCYGEGSVFDRLRKLDAKICTVGISLYWATYRHYIEEFAEVPFRFRKTFHGTVIEDGKESLEEWIYFAAPLGVPNCQPDGSRLERLCRDAGLVKTASLGRGELSAIHAMDYLDYGLEQMKKDPWLCAEGPPCSIKSFVKNETTS